jgi:hypothetical protein
MISPVSSTRMPLDLVGDLSGSRRDRARSRAPSVPEDRSEREPRSALRVAALVAVLAVVVAAAATYPYVRAVSARAGTLERQLAVTIGELRVATEKTARQAARVSAIHAQYMTGQSELAALRAAKIRTVVQTETITEEVPRWVPNGSEVTVEVTGFADSVAIHDVQITHAYGFTDLVGIAVNRSGATVSYAQLGCTFLDADGNVLANGMVNKQSWAPGQSWGFTCSAQVDATGGILRVDEMS